MRSTEKELQAIKEAMDKEKNARVPMNCLQLRYLKATRRR